MSLLTIIIALCVAGIILYAVNRFIPMDPKIKTIINWVVVIILVVWLLKGLGVLAILSGIRV